MKTLWSLFLVSLALTTAYRPTRNDRSGMHRIVHAWKMLEFSFPTNAQRQEAIANGNYVQNNGLPIDVQPHYSKNGLMTFVTIPRFQSGIPYTLATVTDAMGPSGPMLKAYPSFDAHNRNGNRCNLITSAFRVAITECNQMWVIDSGSVGLGAECPPQLLLIDLNTDQIVHRHVLNATTYTSSASLLVTPIVVVRDPPPHGSCRRAMVYVADVNFHGLVVYDFAADSAWRVVNKFMYPDPDYGTHTVAGETFNLMDGIIGMTTDQQNLYFHPMASISEYSVPLRVLNNGSLFSVDSEAMPEAFRQLGTRSSECVATAADSRDNIYCVTYKPIELISWNINLSYQQKNFKKINISPDLLEVVSGMKVVVTPDKQEELWLLSNRFQKYAVNTQNTNEINFRILVVPLGNVRPPSAKNQDLRDKLIFSS